MYCITDLAGRQFNRDGMGGWVGGDIQRPVFSGNDPKKMGARSAQAHIPAKPTSYIKEALFSLSSNR
jgi:hypothetical protein